MHRTSISPRREDYLRAILRLEEETDRVGITKIARYLRLSKSTVSERLKELMRDGFVVESSYASVRLTPRGRKTAQLITYKHRVIEVFLHSILKMPKSKVHKEAHLLEHALSEEVAKKLAHFLGNPRHDPHGMPIPRLN
ncbi:hypothetical protein A3F27_02665 [Candidatus Kaiserbacteria bacterium RIFCSPHIGHO2_12_FULL_53_13]|uniref:Manganese transport regulator n=1 Tax=Candidatus Kaiserbacteria bacterium RIFCSPHIGHO2_12_FULL_53_13 TaxID=1798502 RepID=A0A1F6EBX2_9BACT|nr:MAG: hypothetical protein A3F27_02665 [Candidatus Kaiserbacteria bacterium RIFCSPHIGHO2_12_FULL_53_13]OGG74599.1 MAG: hypothetical protein A3A37_00770 [Candidatus Kaiserbacteria bacterium RIFCSPLOWO2_01_FULL_52_36]